MSLLYEINSKSFMRNNVFSSDNLCCEYLGDSTIFISKLTIGDVK